jgi:type II secretory pathway pseudopilin PulG
MAARRSAIVTRQIKLTLRQEPAEASDQLAAEQRKLADSARQLVNEHHRRTRGARIFGLMTGCAAMIAVILAVGLVGASNEADEFMQAANASAAESAQQSAQAQAYLARIENDNARYFEAASAALAGLTSPLTLDTDRGQTAPWVELLRATANGFLLPPLQHQNWVTAASFDAKGERIVTASGDKTARI